MARVGNAIGTAVDTGLIVMQQLTYTWQPVATIRDRPTTQMDGVRARSLWSWTQHCGCHMGAL